MSIYICQSVSSLCSFFLYSITSLAEPQTLIHELLSEVDDVVCQIVICALFFTCNCHFGNCEEAYNIRITYFQDKGNISVVHGYVNNHVEGTVETETSVCASTDGRQASEVKKE